MALSRSRPIKRCDYGSNTTKPPSDFPGGLMPIKRCSYGSNMPIKRCSYGSNMTKPPSDFLYLYATAKAGLTKTPL